MSETDFNIIFSKNLKRYLLEYDMTQNDLAKKLGVGTSTVSYWCKGEKTPRMDKVDAMCSLFNCKRSDLMSEHLIEVDFSSTKNNSIEKRLIAYFTALNDAGKEEAAKRVQELTCLPQYAATNEVLYAAHEIPGATEEEKKHDNDIMDDENF